MKLVVFLYHILVLFVPLRINDLCASIGTWKRWLYPQIQIGWYLFILFELKSMATSTSVATVSTSKCARIRVIISFRNKSLSNKVYLPRRIRWFGVAETFISSSLSFRGRQNIILWKLLLENATQQGDNLGPSQRSSWSSNDVLRKSQRK